MDTPRVRDTYRHGNLRAEAIDAAIALVVAQGHDALSLRAVAAKTGVAHRSLYNHFKDREALIDAIAEVGYIRLAERLKTAAAVKDYVREYIGFALDNPHLYALMKSRPHATMKERPALQRAVHLGITEALRIFGNPQSNSAENRRAVMKVLILLHGGIALHTAGILDVRDDAAFIEELQAMIASG